MKTPSNEDKEKNTDNFILMLDQIFLSDELLLTVIGTSGTKTEKKNLKSLETTRRNGISSLK